MLLCLSACSEKGETDAKNIKPIEEITDIEGPYYFQSADWPAYKNAEEVINAADLVFLGKIVDIDFQALNHVFLEQIDLAIKYYYFIYH